MSKSDIKISECYVGFLALVDKVFLRFESVRNIFYKRFIRDDNVFLFPCLSFYPSTYCVYAVSDLLQSQGNFNGSKLEHHSLAIPPNIP